MKIRLFVTFVSCLLVNTLAWSADQVTHGYGVDWQNIPNKTTTLFYPGQASWQFLRSKLHPGAEAINQGSVTCSTCHTGQQEKLGNSLVKSSKLEPDPIPGKRPTVELSIQAAFDDDYVYLRFQWAAEEPGVTHTQWRYDGKRWVKWGGDKPGVLKKGIPPSYEDRLAILIGKPGTVPAYPGAKVGFSQAGCFISCHNSMRQMPKAPSPAEVEAHSYFGKSGKKRKDIRKYLLLTRKAQNESGAWDNLLDKKKLKDLFENGQFLDLWQWRASRSNPLGHAGDDHVFEYRWFDHGKNLFTTPKQPAWMYDKSKMGFVAIPEKELKAMRDRYPLVIGENAVPIDASVKFNKGDILPRVVLQEPSESVADVHASGIWKNGMWTVELKRKLNTRHPDDIRLEKGKRYDIGVSVFDDHVSNRRHYVNLPPLTLGLGTDADIIAVKK